MRVVALPGTDISNARLPDHARHWREAADIFKPEIEAQGGIEHASDALVKKYRERIGFAKEVPDALDYISNTLYITDEIKDLRF